MINANSSNNLTLDGGSLTIAQLIDHVRDKSSIVQLSKRSKKKIIESSQCCDQILENKIPCYGINVGFGEMVDITIDKAHIEELQKSLIYTHAVGVKDVLSEEISRTIFLLRLNVLANGASGMRPESVKFLIDLYNQGAYPEIYRSGSLGASGDLGPLSHLAAFAIGQGYGYYRGKRQSAKEIYSSLGMQPLKLARKEGLALINGTSAMVGIGVHAIAHLTRNLELMMLGMAFLLDSFRIPYDFLRLEAFKLKAHPGIYCFANYLQTLLDAKSNGNVSGGQSLQQVYSIRCAPIILGPLVASLRATYSTLTIEANSVSDNPFFLDGDVFPYHGGHFHGAPVSIALDQLRIAAIHMSGLIDRQLEYFLDRKRNLGANPFLAMTPEKGDCGFEGAQYLVTSLHVENKMLSNPYSPLVLPANAGNQDYVSMGMQSALSTYQLAENTKYMVGVYLLAGLQSYKLTNTSPGNQVLSDALDILSKDISIPYQHNILFSELIQNFSTEMRFTECLKFVRDKLPTLPEITE